MIAAKTAPDVFLTKAMLSGGADTLRTLDWAPNGLELLTGSYEGTLTVWNVEAGLRTKENRKRTSAIRSISWSFDGTLVASVDAERSLRIWDVLSDKSYSVGEVNSLRPLQIAWSPSAHLLAMLSSQGTLKIFDGKAKRVLSQWAPSIPQCTSMCWTRDGKSLVVGCGDKTVRVVSVERGDTTTVCRGHGSALTCVVADPLSRFLCSGANESSIRVWDKKSGRPKFLLESHADRILGLSLSIDGRFLLSQSRDNTTQAVAHRIVASAGVD